MNTGKYQASSLFHASSSAASPCIMAILTKVLFATCTGDGINELKNFRPQLFFRTVVPRFRHLHGCRRPYAQNPEPGSVSLGHAGCANPTRHLVARIATVNYSQLKLSFEDKWYGEIEEDTESLGQVVILMIYTLTSRSIYRGIRSKGSARPAARPTAGASGAQFVALALRNRLALVPLYRKENS